MLEAKEWKQQDLTDSCEYWKHILGLDNWRVHISFCRRNDFILGQAQGEIQWVRERFEAQIHILDPIDYPTDTSFEQDIESTIVHELLHIIYLPIDHIDDDIEIPRKEEECIQLHQSMELVERALLQLKRENSDLLAELAIRRKDLLTELNKDVTNVPEG